MVQHLKTIRAWTAISGTALLVLFGVVVYREWNPEWKQVQRRVWAERVRAAERQLEQERARLQSPAVSATLAQLEKKRSGLDLEFARTGREKETKDLLQTRSAIEKQIEQVLARIRQQRLEYQQIESAGPKFRDAAAVLLRLETKDREVERLTAVKDALEDQNRRIAAQIEELERERTQVTRAIDAVGAPFKAAERTLAEARARRLEIKQFILPDDTVDRCASCHSDFQNHPSDYLRKHPVERFGCANCHGGQPRATSRIAAHGHVPHWPAPMLANFELGSACRRCHERARADEPFVRRGERIFVESGCTACHDAFGFAFPKIGPSLGKLAEKARPAWIVYWLRNPKAYLPRTRMPNFQLTDSDIAAIAAFLLKDAKPGRQMEQSGDPESGETLFKQLRCVTCHSVSGHGGTLAPELERIGIKVWPQWLIGFLLNPAEHDRNTRMPRYRLTPSQAADLTAYLMEFTEGETLVAPTIIAADAERGRRLVSRYGCYGCHEIPRFENFPKIGAELDNYGVKPIERLDFGVVRNIPKTWGSWTFGKLKTPRAFRPGLRMPDYGFTSEEAAYLTVFLKSIAELPDSELKPQPKLTATYVPEGQFGRLVSDLKCLVCHSIRGNGGTLAPDLSFEGSRVKEEWLRKFLANPDTIRLYMKERMPKFNLAPSEIDAIVNYIKTTLLNPEIEDEVTTYGGEGRSLYFEKFKCQSCHQLGLTGGAVGPELTRIRERLKPAWLLAWIENSRALMSNVPEPQYSVTDEEARSLAHFLTQAANKP